jgi:hypothetical protein
VALRLRSLNAPAGSRLVLGWLEQSGHLGVAPLDGLPSSTRRGGVIHGVTYRQNQPDTFLEEDFEEAMGTPAMPGAVEAVARLVKVFEGRVWVVSKCGPRIQNLTENWLDRHDFAAATGIDSNHLVFCRQRSEKATRCAELGITHFLDDRSDVLEAMEGIVRHRFMFASRGSAPPAGTSLANDWREAEAQIMSTFGPV